MIKIYFRNFDPMSRALIIGLGEKRAAFHKIEAPVFGADFDLLAIDNLGRTPILTDDMWGNGAIIREALPAFEYLEDTIPSPHFFPGGPMERANVRTFCIEAIGDFAPLHQLLMSEKAHKILNRAGSPDIQNLRNLREGAREFMEVTASRAAKGGFMIGGKFSLADIIIWAQLSLLDYFDLISWDTNTEAKQYYSGLKQRPAFRAILVDNVAGINPPPHYRNLDF
jgi:glutathione S-transferase